MAIKIMIDAGHGGTDFGATYNGRKEKDDNLRLALLVGRLLEDACFDVEYTRKTDVYDAPIIKARKANEANADYFFSFHRNASLRANEANGAEALVFNDYGTKSKIARAVNANMETIGFLNRGVMERPNLVVLKRTKMPAVLFETGFIDNDTDNMIFDENLDLIAKGIADGIIDILGNQCEY